MNKVTIAGFILVLLLIAGGAAWYLVNSSKGIQGPSGPVASTTGTIFSGDAIYTNGPYGFMLQYPETATVSDTFSLYYHLSDSWRANALPNATGTAVVAFSLYHTKSENSFPRYFDALIRVGVSKDPKEIAQCLTATPNQGEVALPDQTIGGRVWKAFSFENAGMQQYVRGVSYRTIHEGACVALEKLAVGSSYRDDPRSPKDISQEVLDSEYAKLDRVINTFTFVR